MGLLGHHYKTWPRSLNIYNDKKHFQIKFGKATNLTSYLNNGGKKSYTVLPMQIKGEEAIEILS